MAPWMGQWLDDIGTLDRLNSARLAVGDATMPLESQSAAFVARQRDVTTHLRAMPVRGAMSRREHALHQAKRQVLDSRHRHWAGLTVLVTRPEVALDNHAAERALRTPVGGRKTYDGSGSVWSARLAAMLWSVLHTVVLYDLHPRHGVSALFHACAAHGGTPPTDLRAFLPWQMTAE